MTVAIELFPLLSSVSPFIPRDIDGFTEGTAGSAFVYCFPTITALVVNNLFILKVVRKIRKGHCQCWPLSGHPDKELHS